MSGGSEGKKNLLPLKNVIISDVYYNAWPPLASTSEYFRSNNFI